MTHNPSKDKWYGVKLAITGFALTLLFSLIMLFCAMRAQGQDAGKRVVFRSVYTGTSSYTSGPLPNIGQAMHLVSATFPDTSSTVTPLKIRVEASYDGALYFAISPDIAQAKNVGGIVYAFTSAYGCYPYIRVRSLLGTGMFPVTIEYSGHTLPVVPFIQQQSDRFIL
jgi:hypothetical protein